MVKARWPPKMLQPFAGTGHLNTGPFEYQISISWYSNGSGIRMFDTYSDPHCILNGLG
jgi:hypothetical protein